MKRRLKYATGIKSALLCKYVLIIFTVVSLTVLYLWEQTEVIRLDSHIRGLRKEMERLRDENSRLTAQVISLSQGCEIVKRAENELNMTYPTEEPVIIIRRAHPDRAEAFGGRSIRRTLSYLDLYGDRKGTF